MLVRYGLIESNRNLKKVFLERKSHFEDQFHVTLVDRKVLLFLIALFCILY
jgi:hypothetical protein